MKEFIKVFFKGLVFGLGFFLIAGIGYIIIKARSSTSTTTDSDPANIYAGANDTLTAAKRNTLVNKSLAGAKTFICEKTFSCPTSGRLSSDYVWTATDCGGTYKPSDFTNCFYAVRKFGGGDSNFSFHAIRPADKNSITLRCSKPNFAVSMNYLCWN